MGTAHWECVFLHLYKVQNTMQRVGVRWARSPPLLKFVCFSEFYDQLQAYLPPKNEYNGWKYVFCCRKKKKKKKKKKDGGIGGGGGLLIRLLYEGGLKIPCNHLFSLHMVTFTQRWQSLHQVWTFVFHAM